MGLGLGHGGGSGFAGRGRLIHLRQVFHEIRDLYPVFDVILRGRDGPERISGRRSL